MLRVLIISLLLLSLPFFFYAAYYKLRRAGEEDYMWRDAPVVWLAIAGVALAVAGLIGLMQLTGVD